MNIADYVISILASRGVRHIYGYPGAAIIPLMDAIKRHPDVEWILMRHEGAAALAASADARVRNKVAVCLVTSGPGATNILTGLADAHFDQIPVLAITGIIPTWKQSQFGFQDLDQAHIFSSTVARSESCIHPDQLPFMLRDCISLAEQQRDVVHLALPFNIQLIETDPNDRRFHFTQWPKPIVQRPPSIAYDILQDEIDKLTNVAIVVGPRASRCGKEIEKFAEKLDAPIISALDAKGIVADNHPCSLGILGIFGAPGVETTTKILSQIDTVIGFGIEHVEPFICDQSGHQIRKFIQFEPDFSSVTNRYHRERTIVGPLDETALELLKRIAKKDQSALLKKASELKEKLMKSFQGVETPKEYIHPVDFLTTLSHRLPKNAIITLDVGDNTVWCAKYLQLNDRQPVLVSNQLGVMGFSLPAAIAAQLAKPESSVVSIAGDGGFQMSLAELLTAVQYKLNIIIAIFNNGLLQRVIDQQDKPYGTKILNPNFVEFAKSCGAEAAVVDSTVDLDAILDQAFSNRDKPFLLDVRIDPTVKVPMIPWKETFVPMRFS